MTLNDLADLPEQVDNPTESLTESMSRTRTTSTGWRLPTWVEQCRVEPDVDLFPASRLSPAALKPCQSCPVRQECLEFALESPWVPYGPWGGIPQGEVQQMWYSRHPRNRADATSVLLALGIA